MKTTTTLSDFAARVIATAAAASPRFRFGSSKVFLGSVYALGFSGEMTWCDFAASLLDALQAGLVVLSRADLVGAMPAHRVAQSEVTTAHGAVFHFVRLD